MYLNYTEYQSMGGQLNEAEFNRLNYIAQAELDTQTFHRITEADERVKECMFALIGINETANNVQSVSNDGYSISYKDTDELKQEQSNIIYKFFADTDLMYRGASGGVGQYTPITPDGYDLLVVKKP